MTKLAYVGDKTIIPQILTAPVVCTKSVGSKEPPLRIFCVTTELLAPCCGGEDTECKQKHVARTIQRRNQSILGGFDAFVSMLQSDKRLFKSLINNKI